MVVEIFLISSNEIFKFVATHTHIFLYNKNMAIHFFIANEENLLLQFYASWQKKMES